MRNNFGKRHFRRIPFSFQQKSKKTVKSDDQSPQNVVLQGVVACGNVFASVICGRFSPVRLFFCKGTLQTAECQL